MGKNSWVFRHNSIRKGLVAAWLVPPACGPYLKGTWEEGLQALEQIYCPDSLCMSLGLQVAHPVIKTCRSICFIPNNKMG